MRRRKRWLWTAAASAVVALLTVVGALTWMRSDAALRLVEQQASERLGREITLEQIAFRSDGVELVGLSMSDPFATTPAFTAQHAVLELDWLALAGGRVEGSLRADDFELRVRKRGSQTNLHGLRRPPASSRPLALGLVLQDGHVVFIDEDRHEEVEAFGIELRSELRRQGEGERTTKAADIELQVERLAVLGLSIDGVRISLEAHDDRLEILECVGTLQGGSVRGSGGLAFSEASAWHADVDLKKIGLEAHVRPVVSAFFPLLGADGAQAIGGTVSLSAQLTGEGFQAATVSRSLAGRARLALDGLELPPGNAWSNAVAVLADSRAPWRLDDLEIDTVVHGGWVRVASVRHRRVAVPLPFRGRARVSGELELDVDLVALLALLTDGGAAWVRRYTTTFDVSVRGTVEAPVFGGPRPGALAQGVANALAQRVLAPAAVVTR